MDIQGWSPYVRFARKKDTTLLQGLLQAVDHRILYFHSGSGHIEGNGKLYPISSGSLFYAPAGTLYRYHFESDIPVYSGCNFDFYQANTTLRSPIPPYTYASFSYNDILEKSHLDNGTILTECLYLENVFQFEEVFLKIAEEFHNHNLYFDVRCSTLLKDILICAVRLADSKGQGINRQKADEILHFIHAHYHEPLTNRQLAEHFGYHENYISTLVYKYTGLTLHQYILNHRMQIAVGLLQSTTLSVSEVAEKIGMPDIKHFSKCFKKRLGLSPSKFKVK